MLPPEIKFMVAEGLSAVDKTSFALVAKVFFRCLSPSGRFPLSEADTIEALLLLERDNPQKFACLSCRKLWPFDASHPTGCLGHSHRVCPKPAERKVKRSLSEETDRGLRLKERPRIFQAPLDEWRLSKNYPMIAFSDARLVMLNHRLGSNYGLPIQSLERSFSFPKFINMNNISWQRRNHFPLEQHKIQHLRYPIRPYTVWDFEHHEFASVIDDELYIHRSHTITGPPVTSMKLGDVLNHVGLPICHHVCGAPMSVDDVLGNWYTIPEPTSLGEWNPSNVSESLKNNRCDKVRRSCYLCFTDYEPVINGGIDAGWKVMLKTYHRLGQCRTMDDIWLSFNSYPCSKEEPVDMNTKEFNTIYFDREGVEVIPFSRPYYNRSPHVPVKWHNQMSEGLGKGQTRKRFIQALGKNGEIKAMKVGVVRSNGMLTMISSVSRHRNFSEEFVGGTHLVRCDLRKNQRRLLTWIGSRRHRTVVITESLYGTLRAPR